MSDNVTFEFREQAYNHRMLTFVVINNVHIDVRQFLSDAREYYVNEIRSILEVYSSVKVNTCIHLTLEKVVIPNRDTSADDNSDPVNNSENLNRVLFELYIQTSPITIERETDINEKFEQNVMNFIVAQIDDHATMGSGFTISRINELEVQINEHDPLRASSYIKTPNYLANKKAIINVQNNDNKCFMWALLASLHADDVQGGHRERVNHYIRFQHELVFTGIRFPVAVKDIDKFEKLNTNISVNVYSFDSTKKKVLILRTTQDVKIKHIHLLLLSEQTRNGEIKQHYCWIQKFETLMASQISNRKKKTFICDRCLNYFWTEEAFCNHMINCFKQNDCQITMPEEYDSVLEFKNYKNQLICPFVIYADIETILKKTNTQFSRLPTTTSTTTALQEHEPYSIGFYLKCSYNDELSYYMTNRGVDCIKWFINELQEIVKELTRIFDNPIPLDMTPEEEDAFRSAMKCHICEKRFNHYHDIIVRDHCHFTGKFRGAAHQNCNLQYRDFRTVPVVFHNLMNYDAHFLIEKIAKGFDNRGLTKVIPITTEKYLSIIRTIPNSNGQFREMIKFKFIDSFRFMNTSLDTLASKIPSVKKRNLMRKHFFNVNENQLNLLERKGILCYDYIDSWEKLNENSLPPKEAFHSSLTNQDISDQQFALANEIWRVFNMQTLGEYTDFYLKIDVLLLVNVFENFRETCQKLYKLDPANYYTTPGLSFDAMLKYTNVRLKLLTDVDMLLFIERGDYF